MQAYSGNGKFIFVSYAHKDSNIVYPFIEQLQKRFNVWYDDGIHLGRDYTEDIMSHLRDSSLFLFMVSKNSMESDFCKKEISFAERRGKSFINIIIEDFNVPDWFDFGYGHLQSFFLFKYSSIDDAIKDLYRKANTWFDECKIDATKQNKVDINTEIVHEAKLDNKETNTPKVSLDEYIENINDFEINDGVLKSYGYKGKDSKIKIPRSVKTIEGDVFYYNKTVTHIYIPETVETIKTNAFLMKDPSLISIEVSPKNPNYASIDGMLVSKDRKLLVFPHNRVGRYEIPMEVKGIGSFAFNGSKINEIVINNYLANIDDSAFYRALGLTSIIVGPYNPYYCDIGGVLFNKRKDTLMSYPTGKKDTFYSTPISTTKIEKYAFGVVEHLQTLELSDNVTELGENAFYFSSIKTIFLPDNMSSLNLNSFYYTSKLEAVIADVNNRFYSTYKGVLLDKSGTRLIFVPGAQKGVFVIPPSVRTISSMSFKECDSSELEKIIIGTNVEKIEDYGIYTNRYGCKWTICFVGSSLPKETGSNWNPLNRPVEFNYKG